MFLRWILLGLGLTYVYLWGDYIKILILLEVLRLVLLRVLMYYISLDYFSLNYFLIILIFLVCESRIGFIFFIFYVRIDRDVVKKLNIAQF